MDVICNGEIHTETLSQTTSNPPPPKRICNGGRMVERKRYSDNLYIIEKEITVLRKCSEVYFSGNKNILTTTISIFRYVSNKLTIIIHFMEKCNGNDILTICFLCIISNIGVIFLACLIFTIFQITWK